VTIEPGSDPRLPRLWAAAEQLELQFPDGVAERLLAFADLLRRWNSTYNLTAVRASDEMLVQHLFDCLAVVAPLRREFPQRAARLLDVGSGGGLPGVVLAVMIPELDVTCVDTVGKKAAFIRQAGVELGLRNLHAEHGRVEAMSGAWFDVVSSRAFASLADFTRLTRSRLAEGGVWMAMKGKRPDDEIAALPPDISVFHVEPLSVPELNAERCLVWMRAVAPDTPARL
jgi:16S rRNA (guanine527-N7)-methyltransferase